MKRMKRILLGVGCVLILAISWLIALTAETDRDKQLALIEMAANYTEDEIYIRAAPLLEEAIGYNEEYTIQAEEALKDVYLHLMDQGGYPKKYTNLLDRQMARKDTGQEVFMEAAEYYLSLNKLSDALQVLRNGIIKTGSVDLTALYEEQRYQYKIGRSVYQEVTMIHNGTIQVKQNDKWGLASADGTLVTPCKYDKISTFSNEQAIARVGDVISGVDVKGNRIALLHDRASDFTNFNENRLGLKLESGWILADGNFNVGSNVFEEIGMYSNGAAPAKVNGKWGLVNTSGIEWVLPAEYDEIIQDELGRSFSQDAIFVRQGNQVRLFSGKDFVGDIYEDAKPFADGWAAVKKNGKWGFVDTQGVVQIDFQFEDALSFGQHLAAIKQGNNWGYVSLQGEIVIEPTFVVAKSFYSGSAPVLTERGWQFITLLEYEGG